MLSRKVKLFAFVLLSAGVLVGVATGGYAQDSKISVEVLRKAAEQGDAASQDKLAQMYADGTGVTKDLAEAAKWWHKAADQGNAHAQFVFGLIYARWDYARDAGVKQNNSEAEKWFRKAAAHGNKDAQLAMREVSAMDDERKASEQGNVEAQRNLGDAYCYGSGVDQDDEQAIFWWQKAAAQGDAIAKLRLKKTACSSDMPHKAQ